MNESKHDRFINYCNIKHNFKYDYSKVKYIAGSKKIVIICSKHGEFNQRASAHKSGQGCLKCYDEVRSKLQISNIHDFIDKSIKLHGDRFDYSKSIYTGSGKKMEILCKIHGSFLQTPSTHLLANDPCPNCRKLSREQIINKFISVHKDKYDYDCSIIDKNTTTKSYIDILCGKHGVFTQRINHHMSGTGCPKCRESKGEILVNEVLCNIGLVYNIDFFRQKTFDNLVFENNLFFDFYLPKYNLCIEYDGDQHFKPVAIFGGDQTHRKIVERDNIKNEYCQKNNIHLLRFNRFDKVKDIGDRISLIINSQLSS